MEPIDYLRVLRLRWKVIAAVTVLGVVAGWLTAPAAESRDPVTSYRAVHTLVVDPNAQGSQFGNNKTLDQVALLATVGEVPALAADELGWEGDPAVLATEVVAVADRDLQTVTIQSTQQDGDRATLVANTFAEALVQYLGTEVAARYQRAVDLTTERMDQLKSDIASLDAQLARQDENDVLVAQRDALVRQYGLAYEQYQQLASQGVPPGGLLTLQRATPIPISEGGFQAPESRPARAALAGFLGLLLGTGIALLLARLDVQVRTKEDAEEAFGAPVLVEVPARARGSQGKRLVTMAQPLSTGAEVHRVLRTALSYAPSAGIGNGNGHSAPDGQGPHTILVTSSVPGEGKTTTAANLAAAYAEIGRSVLVLEADFRRPSIHEMFDVEIAPGIADLLAARRRGHPITSEALGRLAVRTSVPGVRLLPAGRAGAETLVAIGLEQEVITTASQLADVLIVDTSPLLVANDVAELVPAVDSVVVVCRSGLVSREAAERAAERLRRLHAPVGGVVLVAPPHRASGVGNYAYYGYALPRDGGWRRAVRKMVGTSAPHHDPEDVEQSDAELASPSRRQGQRR